MKTSAILFCLWATTSFLTLAIPSTAAASTSAPSSKQGLLLKTDFHYKHPRKSFQIQHETILAADNNSWTPLAPAHQGVVLLGKLSKPKNGVFEAEYMVLDTTSTPVQIDQLMIISQFGQRSSIRTGTDKEAISIDTLVEPTAYAEATASK